MTKAVTTTAINIIKRSTPLLSIQHSVKGLSLSRRTLFLIKIKYTICVKLVLKYPRNWEVVSLFSLRKIMTQLLISPIVFFESFIKSLSLIRSESPKKAIEKELKEFKRERKSFENDIQQKKSP